MLRFTAVSNVDLHVLDLCTGQVFISERYQRNEIFRVYGIDYFVTLLSRGECGGARNAHSTGGEQVFCLSVRQAIKG